MIMVQIMNLCQRKEIICCCCQSKNIGILKPIGSVYRVWVDRKAALPLNVPMLLTVVQPAVALLSYHRKDA